MAVFRLEKKSNYTAMSNVPLQDKALSLKAKGLIAIMLSLPENWDYSLEGLVQLSADGTSSARAAVKELEAKGYLMRKPIRGDGKIRDWEYIIREEPSPDFLVAENLQVENLQVENLQVENLLVENRTQLNTNIIKYESIKEIILYLNERCGTAYKAKTPKTQSLIKARFAEGFTVEDFKTVIDKKVKAWKGTEWEKYLRPETLFGTKFEGYLNEQQTEPPKEGYHDYEQREYTEEDIRAIFGEDE